jgi:peptidoglycan/xylan/chitin deacetylase (PgdA/CDA1 family)
LTFDDGLKEHYTDISPLLIEQRIQGLFFMVTECVQEFRVASVHMNHFLMAALDFNVYRSTFLQRLQEVAAQTAEATEVDTAVAQRTYRWDSPEVASFKYLFNFVLDWRVRDQVLQTLFAEQIGGEEAFSRGLYFTWEEARQMQAAGMLIGGHSHQHRPLATLSPEELQWDLTTCQRLLVEHLHPQTLWPFCYPYGKQDSFNDATVQGLKELRFGCAFSTEVGTNRPGMNTFVLHRLDCKDALNT